MLVTIRVRRAPTNSQNSCHFRSDRFSSFRCPRSVSLTVSCQALILADALLPLAVSLAPLFLPLAVSLPLCFLLLPEFPLINHFFVFPWAVAFLPPNPLIVAGPLCLDHLQESLLL